MDLSPRYFLLLVLRITLIPMLLLSGSAISFAETFVAKKLDGTGYWSGSTAFAAASAACRSIWPPSGTWTMIGQPSTPYPEWECRHGSIDGYFVSGNVDVYKLCSAGTLVGYADICSVTCRDDEFVGPGGSCLPKHKCPSDAVFDPTMNGGEGGCSCTGGKNMVKLDKFSICLEPLDSNSCSPSSPDFAGYINGHAACPGRNHCPNGTKPGFVGNGDEMNPVCYPVPGSQDPNCNGTSGLFNGEAVCIPVFTPDPDCPMGSGTINGVKTCITDPNNDPDCPGGTAGYVGSGSEMNKTCIDSSYKPPTCPPGQYTVGTNGGGFGCVTADAKPPVDPDKPPKPGQVIGGTIKPGDGGDNDGDGNGNTPCPEGKDCSQQQISIKLPDGGLEMTIDGLFEDAPNVDYKKDLDEFGQAELDGVLDADTFFSDVQGADGLFTERGRLEQFASFVKQHTVGSSTSCNGNLPFMGLTVSCDKFASYNRILGWMLSIVAIFYIYKTVMRPSASGV